MKFALSQLCKKNQHFLSGSHFDPCCILHPLAIRQSICCALLLAHLQAPQGETSSFRNYLSCRPREDEATGQYAAVWLATCAPYPELNSLNQLSLKCPSPQFLPSPFLPSWFLIWRLVSSMCSAWQGLSLSDEGGLQLDKTETLNIVLICRNSIVKMLFKV